MFLDDIVHYWPFDGSNNDVIGGDTFSNCASPQFVSDRFGNQNSAANLQPCFTNNALQNVPTDTYFGGDFTIDFWINLRSTTTNGKTTGL